jgi:hypothetical protein
MSESSKEDSGSKKGCFANDDNFGCIEWIKKTFNAQNFVSSMKRSMVSCG